MSIISKYCAATFWECMTSRCHYFPVRLYRDKYIGRKTKAEIKCPVLTRIRIYRHYSLKTSNLSIIWIQTKNSIHIPVDNEKKKMMMKHRLLPKNKTMIPLSITARAFKIIFAQRVRIWHQMVVSFLGVGVGVVLAIFLKPFWKLISYDFVNNIDDCNQCRQN